MKRDLFLMILNFVHKNKNLVPVIFAALIILPAKVAMADALLFTQISTGYVNTCALDASGHAYCWGENDIGQMGNGTTSASEPIPVAVDMDVLEGDVFVKIYVGGAHACGITNHNATWCWGYDSYGQIGDGSTNQDQSRPVPINTTNLENQYFIELSLGAFHTCGITNAGQIYCWGNDAFGQLGNDTALLDSSIPVPAQIPAGESLFTKIASGLYHNCALSNTGNIYCWGRNSFGQLGTGSQQQGSRPTIVNMSPLEGAVFSTLTAGDYNTCGRASNNSWYCWGYNFDAQLPISTDISTPNTTNQYLPAQVNPALFGGELLSFMTLGGTHGCGSTANGSIYCWGSGSVGQRGNGRNPMDWFDLDYRRYLLPDQVDLGPLGNQTLLPDSLSAGQLYSCGIAQNGYGFCWGDDNFGQLGHDPLLRAMFLPSLIGPEYSPVITNLSCPRAYENTAYACEITTEDSDQNNVAVSIETSTCPWITMDSETHTLRGLPRTENITPSCSFTLHATDDGNPPQITTKVLQTTVYPFYSFIPFSTVYSSNMHGCALSEDGIPHCWGNNEYGRVGNGGENDSYQPIPVPINLEPLNGATVSLISTQHGAHTCALTVSGQAFCWGNNVNGQLGNNSQGDYQSIPSPVDMTPLNGGVFSTVSVGGGHTCGLKNNGVPFCWGSNSSGQLGNTGIGGNALLPSRVDISHIGNVRFSSIQAGTSTTCGITVDNQTYCWGTGTNGVLGYGSTLSLPQPWTPVDLSPLEGEHIVSISAGTGFNCGLTESGRAFCWGKGSSGQMGNGASIPANLIPVAVSMEPLQGQTFSKISAGYEHACGLTFSGQAYCWGSNYWGTLGNGNNTSSNIPVAVDMTPLQGEGFINIAAGSLDTCGVTTSGRTFCWGADQHETHGNGLIYRGSKIPQLIFMPYRQNHPPVMNGLLNVSTLEGDILNFSIQISDPDLSDTVTLVSSSLPTGATITGTPGNPANYTLTWAPDYNQAGTYSVSLVVTDGHETVNGSFMIQVDDAPLPTLPGTKVSPPISVRRINP